MFFNKRNLSNRLTFSAKLVTREYLKQPYENLTRTKIYDLVLSTLP